MSGEKPAPAIATLRVKLTALQRARHIHRTPQNLFFISTVIPIATSRALQRVGLDTETQSEVETFLFEVLRSVMLFMNEDLPALYKCLPRIFRKTKPFYTQNFTYAQILHCFFENEWMTEIANRVKNSTHMPLSCLYSTVKFLLHVTPNAESQYFKTVIGTLRRPIYSHLSALTRDDIRFSPKKTIHGIFECFAAVLIHVGIKPGSTQDTCIFSVGDKCFKCESLEKRIVGLNLIKVVNKLCGGNSKSSQLLVEGVKKPMSDVQEHNIQAVDTGLSVSLSKSAVIEMLEENDFVEALFGPSMHVELIERSFEILLFIVQENHLNQKHLELIWGVTVGSHETVVNCVIPMLAKLQFYFSFRAVIFILECLRNTPFSVYTSHHCRLIYKMGFYHSKTTQVAEGCCDILWAIIQDKTGLSVELTTQALSDLPKLIRHANLKASFLGHCIKNLKDCISVIPSLKVLRAVIEANRSQTNSMSEELGSLEKKYNLLHVLIQDLRIFQDCIKEAVTHNPSYSADIFNTPMYGTKATLQAHFSCCFDFLTFVELWDTLITQSTLQQEKELALHWFLQTLLQSLKIVEIHDYFITAKLPSLNFTDTTVAVCSLIIGLFKHVNYNTGALRFSGASLEVCDSEHLKGVEILWRMALEAKEQTVGNYAIQTLLSLQQNMSPALKSHVCALQSQFVSLCMEKLSAANQGLHAMDELCKVQALRTVQRILQTLKDLVKNTSGKNTHGRRCVGGVLPLTVIVPEPTGPHVLAVKMRENDTILQLKIAISSQCQFLSQKSFTLYEPHHDWCYDTTLVSLGNAEVYLSGEGSTLAHHHLQPGAKLFVELLTPQQENTLPKNPECPITEEASIHPVNVLAQEHHFTQLFEVFGYSDNLSGELAWDLLNALPTNDKQLKALVSIGTENTPPNWGLLLDTRSIFKLLYSLMIIASFLEESDDTKEEQERTQWRTTFQQQNGLSYLINDVFIPINFGDTIFGPKRRACLGILLTIINYFLIDPSTETLKEGQMPNLEFFPLVQKLMLEIHNSASSPPLPKDMGIYEDDDLVASRSVTLFVSCVQQNPDLLHSVLTSGDFDSWLSSSLLHSHNTRVRQAIYRGFYKLCTHQISLNQEPSTPLSEFFLTKLCQILQSLDATVNTCEQYFTFLAQLIEESCKNPEKVHMLHPLATSLVEMIKSHPIMETRWTGSLDLFLMGLMMLTTIFLKHSDTFRSQASMELGLFEEVYHKCLFDMPTTDDHGPLAPPKCKTQISRKRAYTLLEELCTCPSNLEKVCELISSQNLPSQKPLWNCTPDSFVKHAGDYVGLSNLGATCYMNALLQQLYMHVAFRYSMLQSRLHPSTNREESVLYQIQNLFSGLQESERKFLDTRPLCNAIKRDGSPLNTLIQMDADEFFAQLFDTLDSELKKGGNEDILQKYFGGTVCHQVVSKECPHVSEREESFFTLALELKGRGTLNESLLHYIEGDQLTGDNKYFCGTCQAKVDAVKRCCLAKLPASLVIHSKRFEYDFELMRRIKVNDLYEFPMKLDLEPYTKEGLARREKGVSPLSPTSCEYDLVGVLVHSGTAESGHYYSYIRERSTPDGSNPKWLQFNDTYVEPFDISGLPRQCFGGTETILSTHPQTHQQISQNVPRVYNAYMLFYDKCDTKHPPMCPASQLIPADIFQALWADNTTLLQAKNIFDDDYTGFLVRVLSAAAHLDPGNRTLLTAAKAGTRFLFNTLARSRSRTHISQIVELLKTFYSRCTEVAEIWITEMLNGCCTLKQILLDNPAAEARNVAETLLVHAISALCPSNRPLYGQYLEPQTQHEVDCAVNKPKLYHHPLQPPIPGTPISLIIKFLDLLLSLQSELTRYWRSFSQYFKLFFDFANLGILEKSYIIERRVVEQFLDLYMGNESPWAQLHGSTQAHMGDKFASPDFTYLFSLVALMVPDIQKTDTQLKKSILSLPSFYSRLLKEPINPIDVGQIVQVMGEKNQDLMQTVISSSKNAVGSVSGDVFKTFFAALRGLTQIQDNADGTRISNIISSILPTLKENRSHQENSVQLLQWLLDMMKTDSRTKRPLWDNRKSIEVLLVIASTTDNVKETAANVLKILVLDSSGTLQTRDVETLFRDMMELCSTAKQHLPAMYHTDGQKTTAESTTPSLKLLQFGKLLNWCFTGDSQHSTFLKMVANFTELLREVDARHCNLDESKVEMNRLLLSACDKIPEVLKHMVTTCSSWLAQFHISLNTTKEYTNFNARATPPYYGTICLMCKHSPEFLHLFGFHVNLLWASRHILSSAFYIPEAADSILEILHMAANNHDWSAEFRSKTIPSVVGACANLSENSTSVLSALKVLMQTEPDQIVFCTCKPDSCAAIQAILNFLKLHHNTGHLAVSAGIIEPALCVLSLATQWLNRTTPDLADMKKLFIEIMKGTTLDELTTCLHGILKEITSSPQTSHLHDVVEQSSSILMTLCRLKECCLAYTVNCLQKEYISASNAQYITFGQEAMKLYMSSSLTKPSPDPRSLEIGFDYMIDSSLRQPTVGGLGFLCTILDSVPQPDFLIETLWAGSMKFQGVWHDLLSGSTSSSSITPFFIRFYPLVSKLLSENLKINVNEHLWQQVHSLVHDSAQLPQEELVPLMNLIAQLQACSHDAVFLPLLKSSQTHSDLLARLASQTAELPACSTSTTTTTTLHTETGSATPTGAASTTTDLSTASTAVLPVSTTTAPTLPTTITPSTARSYIHEATKSILALLMP
ncbi:ubiquitin hydrolase [Pelomyxa schiedti]|nr:ubiquitin hydrolase [Pelomyxa schiedti]